MYTAIGVDALVKRRSGLHSASGGLSIATITLFAKEIDSTFNLVYNERQVL